MRDVVGPGVEIRRPQSDEPERLREIMIASKAHWGYDRDWVVAWVARDFSGDALARNETFVADAAGTAVGWAMLVPRGEVGWLEDMWIEPAWIGRGIGTQLFERVASRARELGARRLEWEAEPNATGFYERMGGRHIRDSETNEWGRTLSIMGCDLGER